MWNLSNTIRALGALLVTELRNAFHMSIAASSMRATLFVPQLPEKQVHVGFRASLAANPDGTTPDQITHDDPIVMALADRNLIDSDGAWRWKPGAFNLALHVELVQVLHRAVVKTFHLGYRLVGHVTAELAHMHRIASCIARVLCQPIQTLYMHAVTHRALDPPPLKLQVDAPARYRQISGMNTSLIVTCATPASTVRANCSFFRLRNRTIRAYRSPKRPANLELATKPGKVNKVRMDLGFFTRTPSSKAASKFVNQ